MKYKYDVKTPIGSIYVDLKKIPLVIYIFDSK